MELVYSNHQAEEEQRRFIKRVQEEERSALIAFLEAQIQHIKDHPDENYDKALVILTNNDAEVDAGYNFLYAGFKTTIFDVLFISERIKFMYMNGDISTSS